MLKKLLRSVEGGRSEMASSAVSDGDAESDAVFGKEFREAVDGEKFEWLRESSSKWAWRKDLLDDVIARGADVTIWFIQNVGCVKSHVLVTLFDKGEGIIDEVLGGIKYDDEDLCVLMDFQKELAGSPEKFFRILDKIKAPDCQERAVCRGVGRLFDFGRHDLVVPLVNALGKRAFKSESLKEEAIRHAFIKELQRQSRHCGVVSRTSGDHF